MESQHPDPIIAEQAPQGAPSFTPGSWWITHRSGSVFIMAGFGDTRNQFSVAKVYAAPTRRMEQPRDETQNANARLIAQAPRLFAIAKGLASVRATILDREADRATAGNVNYIEALLSQLDDVIERVERVAS